MVTFEKCGLVRHCLHDYKLENTKSHNAHVYLI